MVLKSGRPALGYLCVRGARHPRVARAGPPIVVELGSPLYDSTRAPDRGTRAGAATGGPAPPSYTQDLLAWSRVAIKVIAHKKM